MKTLVYMVSILEISFVEDLSLQRISIPLNPVLPNSPLWPRQEIHKSGNRSKSSATVPILMIFIQYFGLFYLKPETFKRVHIIIYMFK